MRRHRWRSYRFPPARLTAWVTFSLTVQHGHQAEKRSLTQMARICIYPRVTARNLEARSRGRDSFVTALVAGWKSSSVYLGGSKETCFLAVGGGGRWNPSSLPAPRVE